MTIISLFFGFVKYGLLCFGGGYMIIPLLYADFVEKAHLFTPESYGNLLSVSQMTPGAVSVNTATYVGFVESGFPGAVAATLGLCVPTFVLISAVLTFLNNYKDRPLVIGFFSGVKWVALVMLFSAIGLFAEISVLDISEGLENFSINWLEVFIMLASVYLSRQISFTKILFLSALIGYVVSYI